MQIANKETNWSIRYDKRHEIFFILLSKNGEKSHLSHLS